MNVLFLAEVSIRAPIGGAERVLREEAFGLRARGHRVRVIARQPPGDILPACRIDGVEERRYPVSRSHEPAFVLSSMRRSVQTFDALMTVEPAEVGVIHQSLAGLGAILLRRRHLRRWVYICHSLAHEEYSSRIPQTVLGSGRFRHAINRDFRRAVERYVMRRCDSVVVLSEFMRQRVATVHGLGPDRLLRISGAADTNQFRPGDRLDARRRLGLDRDARLVLTVRNLVPRMGLDALIDATARLNWSGVPFHLLIGGDGPLRPVLEQAAVRHGVATHVRFLGFLPDDLLATYYQAADVAVLPTRQLEGFGLVAVEALACGTPVVATPVGALPEILQPIDGALIAKSAEPADLAQALAAVLERLKRPEERMRLAGAVRETVERQYTWPRHCDALEAALRAEAAR